MAKTISFYAGEGMSFYVPFGFTPVLLAVSPEFVATFLAGDPKAKEAMAKLPKCTERIASIAVHQIFDSAHDSAQPGDVKNVAAYSWAKAGTFIPTNWREKAVVQEYWASLPDAPHPGEGGGDPTTAA